MTEDEEKVISVIESSENSDVSTMTIEDETGFDRKKIYRIADNSDRIVCSRKIPTNMYKVKQ